MKYFRLSQIKNLFAFCSRKSIYQSKQSPSDIVSKIIQNHNRKRSYAFEKTKQIAKTISNLFELIPQSQMGIFALQKLLYNIHLSSFSSWKALRQTSITIKKVLNQNLAQKTCKLPIKNLILLCKVLQSLNYQLQPQQDSSFFYSILIEGADSLKIMKIDLENLQLIQALSRHPKVFQQIIQHKKNFQEKIIQQIAYLEKVPDNYKKVLCVKIIKNGIYSNFWSSQFIVRVLKHIVQKQILTIEEQSLLNTIKLNSTIHQSADDDIWKPLVQKTKAQSSNIVTQLKIDTILRQLDYSIRSSVCLLNFQVDYLLGDDCIVEYHGIHHYRINTRMPIQTVRSSWKVQAFKRRGYKVCVIPFYEWNKLQNSYRKKAWLINRLQTELFLS